MRLFVDLDGVLADFDGHFKALTGKLPSEVQKKFMWRVIMSTPDFFATLPAMPDASRLWEGLRRHRPIILTGAPPSQAFREQKQTWVAEKLGRDVEVIVLPKKQKSIHAAPGHVLIDDTDWVIDAWRAAGGFGIHHISVNKTLADLEGFLQVGG